MIRLHVADMACNGCAQSITRAIARVAPGATVEIDLATKHVAVSGSEDRAAILEAVKDAGYAAEPQA